jgi:hypothetical protein
MSVSRCVPCVFVALIVASVACAADAPPTGIDAFCAAFVSDAPCAWDSPRAKEYVALFDEGVALRLPHFDFDRGLLDLDGAMPPPEVTDMDRVARKRYAGMPEYSWIYRMGRTSASDIGAFALAWALPGSQYHGDERLRAGAIRGIEAYLENQLPSGEFAFSSIRTSSCYGTHEMAWRLEPLMAAYLCVRHTLEPEQDRRFRDGLAKAADYLYANVNTSQSNRGTIWCGVMAVAAKVFDRDDYLEGIRANWGWVGRRVFAESGEVVEGPGPDMGYSYITLLYAFRQRAALERTEMDAPLCKSLDWFYRMHDGRGIPFQAPSTRMNRFNAAYTAYLLSALEAQAGSRPYYSGIAQKYLDILEDGHAAITTDHGGIPWVTAAALHQPDVEPGPLPDALRRHTDYYSYDVTKYVTVRRDYRTMITLAGVHEYAGLQHWCLDGERPLICESPGVTSGIMAWGLDTARVKVGKGTARHTLDKSALDTLTIDWGGVWTCYVFGERATWVINAAQGVEREVRWVVNGAVCPKLAVDGKGFVSAGQRSRMDMGPLSPTLAAHGASQRIEVRVPATEPVDWTVLHDGTAAVEALSCEDGVVTGRLREGDATFAFVMNLSNGGFGFQGQGLAAGHARVGASD